MKDGGPAFPRPLGTNSPTSLANNPAWSTAQDGMSLRDYLAAKAMAVIAADYIDASRNPEKSGSDGAVSFKGIAQEAYSLADAMLAERAKP